MLELRYEKVDLKNSFKQNCEKLITCTIKELKKTEDIMMLFQYLKDPKYVFD